MTSSTDAQFITFFREQNLLYKDKLTAEFSRAWRNVGYFSALARIRMRAGTDKAGAFYNKLTDIIDSHDILLADRLAKVVALNEEMEAENPEY
jgi:hypothetical protein